MILKEFSIADIAFKNDDRYKVNPTHILIDAVNDNREIGSCTCVLSTLDEKAPLLYTANLGDSGYMLLRKQGLDLITLFRSKEQQHSFNFPFQVGTGGDDPAKAENQIHDIKDQDILVMGSDGLWDNLFDIKIIDMIRPFLRDQDEIVDPELVAEVIATEAEKYSLQQHYMSPFAKGAREYYYDYSGGKPDDITVIVAQIRLAHKEDKL